MNFRTPLSKVKHLGAAESGTFLHIIQTKTSYLLIPIIFYLMVVMSVAYKSGIDILFALFAYKTTLVTLVIFALGTLLHGYVGLQMVSEDYIHSKKGLAFTLNFLKGLCVITWVAFIITVLNFSSILFLSMGT